MCSSLSFLSFFPVWTKKLCWCWCWCCWWLGRTVCLIRWIKFVVGVVAGICSTRLKPQTSLSDVRVDNGLKLTAAAAAVLGTRPLITWPLIVLKPRQGSADIDSRSREKSVMFVSFLGPLCSLACASDSRRRRRRIACFFPFPFFLKALHRLVAWVYEKSGKRDCVRQSTDCVGLFSQPKSAFSLWSATTTTTTLIAFLLCPSSSSSSNCPTRAHSLTLSTCLVIYAHSVCFGCCWCCLPYSCTFLPFYPLLYFPSLSFPPLFPPLNALSPDYLITVQFSAANWASMAADNRRWLCVFFPFSPFLCLCVCVPLEKNQRPSYSAEMYRFFPFSVERLAGWNWLWLAGWHN